MDKLNLSQHISQQYNAELETVRSQVLMMGGLVEQQISNALKSLVTQDAELGQEVVETDTRVNGYEVNIDEECGRILARRQPAASDLRLITTIIKTITDLERMGDEAEKIGRLTGRLAADTGASISAFPEIESMGEHVCRMVRHSLDAFARLDAEASLEVVKEDKKSDRYYESIMRQCITFMMEDPRTISRVLNLMWSARAFERIGDHAKNIGEYVIFLVGGKDVRHFSIEEIAETIEEAQGQGRI